MKKILWLVVMLLVCILALLACDDNKQNQIPGDTSLVTNDNTTEDETDIESKIIFNTLTVAGNNVKGEVANKITTFSFLEEIEVYNDAEYLVSSDVYGRDIVPTKTVALNEGDNTFYVFAIVDGQNKLYTVTIHRRAMYKVVFDTIGGAAIENQIVEEGCLVSVPEIPTKEGYTFVGWDYEIEKPITSDIVIKAKWAKNRYEIIYDANGGSVKNNVQTIEYNSSYTLETPTRKGYTFLGWYSDGKRFYAGTWRELSNVTLKAKWDTNTYYISYVNNGGVHANPTSYTVEDEIELCEPTKKGYTFIGWTYEGQTTPEINVKIFKGSTNNKEYTANWIVNTYQIIYDANGGSVKNNVQTIEYNSSYTLETPTRKGYTFLGWYSDGKRFYAGTWRELSNVTLKAKWDTNTYYISYVNNGGVHANPTSYTVEDEIELCEPTKKGYTFLGWTYEGQTTPELNVKIFKGSTNNKEYTANWIVNTYQIIYDANGGSVKNNVQTIEYNSSYTLETPTRKGYTFLGWYDGNNVYYGGIWKEVSDVTLKAKWDINSYYVSVNGTYGGKVNGGGEYKYNSTVTVYADTKLGYTWLGWYDTNDVLVSIQSSYVFVIGDSNVALNAKWKTSDDMSDFEFSSTYTTCTILDVKDDTKSTYQIPSYVTSIGDWAFFMCDYLTNITIPNGVTVIGDNAFSGCDKLSNIQVPDSVNTIGKSAFSSCDSLSSVTIPKNVTKISEYAFSNCGGLTTVIIHSNVTFVGKNAFSGCVNLTNIVFKGNKSSWENIQIGNNWNFMVPATEVACLDGVVKLN